MQASVLISAGGFTNWPPKQHSLLIRGPVEGGQVSIWITPLATISLVIEPAGRSAWQVETCALAYDPNGIFHIGASWGNDAGDASIYVNGIQAYPPDIDLIRSAPQLPPNSSFMAANEATRKERVERLAQLIPKQGRRAVTLAETLEDLQNCKQQVEAILVQLSNGSLYWESALPGIIRSLICQFKGPSFPLLQRTAGMYGLPLIIHSNTSQKFIDTEPMPAVDFKFSIALDRRDASDSKVDIDIWLGREDVRIGNTFYTNNLLIRSIADTHGSHYDPSVEPLYDWLKELYGMASTGSPKTHLNAYFTSIAQTVVGLADQVLRHAHSVATRKPANDT